MLALWCHERFAKRPPIHDDIRRRPKDQILPSQWWWTSIGQHPPAPNSTTASFSRRFEDTNRRSAPYFPGQVLIDDWWRLRVCWHGAGGSNSLWRCCWWLCKSYVKCIRDCATGPSLVESYRLVSVPRVVCVLVAVLPCTTCCCCCQWNHRFCSARSTTSSESSSIPPIPRNLREQCAELPLPASLCGGFRPNIGA